MKVRKMEAAGITYVCVKCGARVSAEQLTMIPEVKCPYCGYRVLKKIRPPIVKHVKAK